MAGPSGADKREVSEAAAAAEEESESEDEDIGDLLEPFTRDELLGLLTDACLREPALLARIAVSAASDDAAHRRLFVHGLGPGATSDALAAAFAPFGAFDECHAVADRATDRCRGYGFVTFRRRCAARRALADSSKRVDGRPVACQLAALGPVARSSLSDRKLFVGNVPERAAHDDLRGFFSEFGGIEEGPLGADRATGLFRGYAIFLYKTPEGLRKALEEPTKVFDGCELQCRRAYKVSNRKHTAAAPAGTAVRSNGGADAAVLSSVQDKDLALTSKHSLLQSNQPVGLKVKESTSATAAAATLFRQNVPAGGTGILGAVPVATVVPSSLVRGTSSTPPSGYVSAIGHVELNGTARVESNNSASSLQVQGLGTARNAMPPSLHPGQLSTRPGLIQHYLGR
jgi:heterogeneous nuclear ribonucleoprotein A1/A3